MFKTKIWKMEQLSIMTDLVDKEVAGGEVGIKELCCLGFEGIFPISIEVIKTDGRTNNREKNQ